VILKEAKKNSKMAQKPYQRGQDLEILQQSIEKMIKKKEAKIRLCSDMSRFIIISVSSTI
jgi:hypothetical protein